MTLGMRGLSQWDGWFTACRRYRSYHTHFLLVNSVYRGNFVYWQIRGIACR